MDALLRGLVPLPRLRSFTFPTWHGNGGHRPQRPRGLTLLPWSAPWAWDGGVRHYYRGVAGTVGCRGIRCLLGDLRVVTFGDAVKCLAMMFLNASAATTILAVALEEARASGSGGAVRATKDCTSNIGGPMFWSICSKAESNASSSQMAPRSCCETAGFTCPHATT